MKRTPLLRETKPRTPGSTGITYLSSPPKPAEGMIGDIVVDVFTSTYFIKTDAGWVSSVSEGLRKAIDASTLRLERNAGKPFILAADVSRAHFRIHSKMADVNIRACYRSGTELRAGWAR